MIVWLLTGCFGTYMPVGTELGPYQLTLPDGLDFVPAEPAGESTVLARYQGAAPAREPKIIVTRPAAVSDLWLDGGLPTSIIDTREALTPIEYREVLWLGDRASLGQMTMPDGTVVSTWGAVRDGWLHELECRSAAGGEGVEDCYILAAGVKLVGAPAAPRPLPSTTRAEAAGPLQVAVPEGWQLAPVDPATPEPLLQAAPPPPTDPKAPREMGHLAVELYPDIRLLGTWVSTLQSTYAETGMELVGQEKYKSQHGNSFVCEYSDGLGTTFTYDAVTTAGMVHVACSDNVTRRADLRVLCSKVFQGTVVKEEGDGSSPSEHHEQQPRTQHNPDQHHTANDHRDR